MLTFLLKSRSLTFYQTIESKREVLDSSYANGIASDSTAALSYSTAGRTNSFNIQLNDYLTKLNAEKAAVALKYDLSKPNTLARQEAVRIAWEYEKADIEMGGSGSADWSESQKSEILKNGKVVKNAAGGDCPEGHHQKSVAKYPECQADPNNIKFYKNREIHLKFGHDGNFQNSSDAPMIDKNKMLQKTNSKRVVKNEFQGLGLAVAIGAGLGFTIGFATSLAMSGITPDSLKPAFAEGGRSGVQAGVLSAVNYGIGRTIGESATMAVCGMLKNAGLTVSANLSKMIDIGIIGMLTITVTSVCQFAKLKLGGLATKDALIRVGKQTMFSLSILAVSIAAQGIWGGAAGIIVSISIGIIMITYSVADQVHSRCFAEKIRVYTIEKCYPTFR